MFKRLRDWANEERMAPEPYSFLPAPEVLPSYPPDPPTVGWWKDPLSSNEVAQRYYDGTTWTPYVRVRTAKSWTQIFDDGVNTEVDPGSLGIPRPPAVPEPPADPPTSGWWEDPLEPKLRQARYFDGTEWTDLIAPTKSEGPRLVTRRRDAKEVVEERKAAEAGAKPSDDGPNRRWPWSRGG